MSRPIASVVVPSYRGAERLAVLFAALRAQRFDRDWEAVVVLDGVVDDSESVVAAAQRDLPVRVVCFEQNRGRPAALNAGFAAARGEVLIRCDDDLGVPPTFLERHVAAHAGDGPVGVVGLTRDAFAPSRYATLYGLPANERLRKEVSEEAPEVWWRHWAANCSVTRKTFDRVGPYDERFRDYGWEDVDWGYRLHVLGIPVLVEPGLEVVHRAASSSVAVRAKRAYLGGHAHARFDAKHGVDTEGNATPVGMAQRAWATAVDAVAKRGTSARFERWGSSVDRRLAMLPAPVAAKLVALLVEAGGRAGYLSLSEPDVRHGVDGQVSA